MSYLPLLLCRLVGSDDPQDEELPLQVLVNLAKSRFNPIYNLLMGTAVEASWNFLQDPMPWDTVIGGYYSPENAASYTFEFADRWPDGRDWAKARFDASSGREQQILASYSRLLDKAEGPGVRAFQITEPLVALFFALCYAAERGIAGNEEWLDTVATSQRIRWEALLKSELYRDYMRELGL